MDRPVRTLQLFGAAILLVASSGAFSADCGQQSPRFAEEGDKYYEVAESSGLSDKEGKTLNRLAEKIRGDWSGDGTSLECSGSQLLRIERRDIESDLNIKLLNKDELHITEERLVKPEKILRRDVAKLFSRWSNAQVHEISDTKLVAIEKYRRQTGHRGAGLWEIAYDLRVSDGDLHYTTTRYINGYLASRDTRHYRGNPYKR
jgi:hypothetical protein